MSTYMSRRRAGRAGLLIGTIAVGYILGFSLQFFMTRQPESAQALKPAAPGGQYAAAITPASRPDQ